MELQLDAVLVMEDNMSSSELSDPEFDLSCSESSADLSPEFGQSSDLHAQESCLMEYRLLSTMEARSELQWLHDSENRMWRSRVLGALTKAQSHLRQLLVDTLCVAGERMHLSFATKVLAVSYLDRFMAIMPEQDEQLIAWAAMACLSIAAKTDEVCMPTQMLTTQLHSCWELKMPPGCLGEVELMVLSALGWSIQDVTVASVLDTLVCLLGYEQSSLYKSGCYEQMHVVRESCRLLLAKALRDPIYNRFRPSVLATAACLLVLDSIKDLQTNTSRFQQALTEVHGSDKNQEVIQCMLYLKSVHGIELIPSLRHCRVEVAGGDGLVRVYQQKVADSITTTPTSVLKSSQAMAYQPVHRSECPDFATKSCNMMV